MVYRQALSVNRTLSFTQNCRMIDVLLHPMCFHDMALHHTQ